MNSPLLKTDSHPKYGNALLIGAILSVKRQTVKLRSRSSITPSETELSGSLSVIGCQLSLVTEIAQLFSDALLGLVQK